MFKRRPPKATRTAPPPAKVYRRIGIHEADITEFLTGQRPYVRPKLFNGKPINPRNNGSKM